MARRTKLEPHLTPDELKQRYLKTEDLSERSHFHVLWLISQGETQERAAQVVGISARWVQEIVKRYNAGGAEAMRDRRHDHPGAARTLNAEGERALEAALQDRPADGGLEPWEASWLLVAGSRSPTHSVAVGEDDAAAAVASLEAHQEYLADLPDHPDPAEFIPAMLRETGVRAGVPLAVDFRAFRLRD